MIIEHSLCKMADLDDFFAKKDRKKSKNVKKFATADEVAKKLEDTKKADKLVKKDRVLPAGQEGDESGAPNHVRIFIKRYISIDHSHLCQMPQPYCRKNV